MQDGGWQGVVSEGMKGKTLGILGLGKLGSRVAKVALALEMDVVAWSENLTPERCQEVGVNYVTKDALFAESDIISIHLVLSDRTRGMIGVPELTLMKSTAYLVNTSRGPIVDEAALIEALANNTIAGAGILYVEFAGGTVGGETPDPSDRVDGHSRVCTQRCRCERGRI